MKKRYNFSFKITANTIKLYTVFLSLCIFLLKTGSLYSQTPLVTNIVATTGHTYTLSQLAVGAMVYSDRTYQVTSVPAFLNNVPFIQTPNADKGSKSTSVLSFTLTQNAVVYVGYDPRATVLPAWLSGWQKTTNQIGFNDPNISFLWLYTKTYQAGQVTLGGTLASPAAGAKNTYIVVVQPTQYSLNVNTTGNGTVIKNPNQTTYNNGSTVSLTATPTSGQQFTGWSGDASGTTNPLTVTMDANKSITATFAPIQYSLGINTNGNGTVAKSPDQQTYASGSTVSLTATPASGQQFTGWSGDASGMGMKTTGVSALDTAFQTSPFPIRSSLF